MLKLPMIFSAGMVLQANAPVKIWGEAKSGEMVCVTIQGLQKETMVNNGYWEVTFEDLSYGTKEQLEVICGEQKKIFSDIAIGEVWLIGGQSNAEFQLYFDSSYDEVLREQQEEQIRFFDYPEIAYEDALIDFDYSDYGIWRKNDTYDNLKHFSAVGYYFARQLARQTGHVVGLVGCNWGGSPAYTWFHPSYIENTKGNIWLQDFENQICEIDWEKFTEDYKKSPDADRSNLFHDPINMQLLKGMSHEEQLNLIKNKPVTNGLAFTYFSFAPGRLYEHMVKNIAAFSVKGVLWYQGESDSLHPEVYDVVLTALIHCWRDLWGAELPFYIVQLPAFEEWMGLPGVAFPTIRRMQEIVTDTVSNTFLCSIMDCGMRFDIHPKNKRPVGERLVKLALKNTYGYDIQAGSPRPEKSEKSEGQIVLHFTAAVGGLFAEDIEKIRDGIEITIKEQKVEDYEIKICEDCMIFTCSKFHRGEKVQIAFANEMYYLVPVFNQEGFAVRPFILKI